MIKRKRYLLVELGQNLRLCSYSYWYPILRHFEISFFKNISFLTVPSNTLSRPLGLSRKVAKLITGHCASNVKFGTQGIKESFLSLYTSRFYLSKTSENATRDNNNKCFICMTIKELQYCKSYCTDLNWLSGDVFFFFFFFSFWQKESNIGLADRTTLTSAQIVISSMNLVLRSAYSQYSG